MAAVVVTLQRLLPSGAVKFAHAASGLDAEFTEESDTFVLAGPGLEFDPEVDDVVTIQGAGEGPRVVATVTPSGEDFSLVAPLV